MAKPNRFEENSAPTVGDDDEELHAYQDALVRKGLQEMRQGRDVSHAEVVKRLKR
jgi:predicted transcriptional regulator